jgi:CSLREA domain-containing protein
VNNKFLNKINLFLLFSILLLAGAAQQTLAATLTVTKVADTNDAVCNADCSLREAVAVAQSGDEITFQPALAGGTITLALDSITISNKSITITGIDNLKISGANKYRIFTLHNQAHATMKNLDLGYGYMDSRLQPYVGVGGAIAVYWSSLSLDDCYIHNNKAFTEGAGIWGVGSFISIKNSLIAANSAPARGAGLSAIDSRRLSISNTKFNLNSSTGNGGAIFLEGGNFEMTNSSIYKSSAKKGGAIYLEQSSDANYTIRNSAIFSNSAENSGGIYNAGKLNLINSTLSGNKATAGNGGGLSNNNQVLMRNVTAAFNTATGDAGGIESSGSGEVNFGNTIIAGNTSGTPFFPNLKGATFTSAGYNVIGAPKISTVIWGDQTGNQENVADPMLNPLAYNGGTTLNHLPKPGSPVIDAGSVLLATDEFGSSLPFDQRGLNRVFGVSVDVGAVEAVY